MEDYPKAGERTEKQRLYSGRFLLSHASMLKGILWNLEFQDESIVSMIPSNNNATFERWLDSGRPSSLMRVSFEHFFHVPDLFALNRQMPLSETGAESQHRAARLWNLGYL